MWSDAKSKCTKHTNVGPLLAVVMSKKCTPLWREAHVQVKIYKAHHVRTTFGSWHAHKVHAVVAQSTFQSQITDGLGAFLEVDMSKKCAVVARCTCWSQNCGVRSTFGRSDVVLRGRQKGFCTLSKVSKTWGFCSSFNYNHHYSTLRSTTLHYSYNYNYITLHYTTLIAWH